MAAPNPACPLRADAAWRLVAPGVDSHASGTGLESGLHALWDHVVRAQTTAFALLLEDGQGAVQIADHPGLERLATLLANPKQRLVVIHSIAAAHAKLLRASTRWDGGPFEPWDESLPILPLASLLDEPDVLIRALKEGH